MKWDPSQPIVSIVDVRKAYGSNEVLKGVTLNIMKGEVVCIIGPSGSGKSTLIRCVNGLNDIQAGSIKVEGQEVHDPKLDKLALRKKVGMVFQQYNLFPHKTVLENVMMAPVIVLHQKRDEVEKRARAAEEGASRGQGKRLSRRTIRRSAAARGDRAQPCDEPGRDAV